MSSQRTVFLFCGQGSQYFQMGRELFEQLPVFRAALTELDRQARASSGRSIVRALYDDACGKADAFEQLELTHPAIFMVQVALAQTLQQGGIHPDMALGVSLGSFAAAVVCGCVSAQDALQAVIQQARAISTYCAPGVMISVLSAPGPLREQGLMEDCELAAINAPRHCVIAAPRERAARVESRLQEMGVTFQRLPVGYAFHSRWIDAAAEACRIALQSLQLRPPAIPLMCCAEARCVEELRAEYFWQCGRRQIRLGETLAALESGGPCVFVDAGPGATLATILKHTLPTGSTSSVRAVMSPFGADLRRLGQLFTS